MLPVFLFQLVKYNLENKMCNSFLDVSPRFLLVLFIFLGFLFAFANLKRVGSENSTQLIFFEL